MVEPMDAPRDAKLFLVFEMNEPICPPSFPSIGDIAPNTSPTPLTPCFTALTAC